MLRNRTLPIVALLAGAMMFGACADDVAGPGPGQPGEYGVAAPPGPVYTPDLPAGAEVKAPDGEWTEFHPHDAEAQ
ncbi:MAG: hypothetical protein M8860_07325 [marine benthic group bacterium]|nr:hypothetical protein [Candidatus Carthagonibacter metallireducens]